MARATCEMAECLGFRGLRLRNVTTEMILVPEIGGRILGFGPIGHNLLFVNEALRGRKPHRMAYGSPGALAEARLAQGILLYGGEKTWLAPQDDWGAAPYADLDHGAYAFRVESHADGIRVVLESPVCSETGIQIVRTVEFPAEGSQVRVRQRMENLGTAPKRKGLWQVIMLNRPGRVAFPIGPDAADGGAGGIHCFYPEQEDRLPLSREGSLARVACEEPLLFKVGTAANEGWVRARMPDEDGLPLDLVVQYPVTSGPYGHGCAVEVYNAPSLPYFEVETHGPLLMLQPGGSTENEIIWSLERP